MQNEFTMSVEEFQYPPSGLPMQSSWQDGASVGPVPFFAPLPVTAEAAVEDPTLANLERAVAEGRREGIGEGRRLERLESASRLERHEAQIIEQAAKLNEQLTFEHERFLQAVEPEIVKLALAVASRILRREVQFDPLVLTGAVRAALAQLTDKAAVRIQVPASDASLWTETIARLPGLRVKPVVVEDEKLHSGECQLESDLGSADLSLHSQLCEIGRSFLNDGGTESKPSPSPGSLERPRL
jgi:flagellar biosynthesis/type III secretory pathway protein FliH